MDVESVTITRNGPDSQQEEKMSEGYQKLPTDYKMLAAMQEPFYYRQDCNMRVHAVYHPEDEKKGIVSLKKGVVAGFSHHIVPKKGSSGAQTYEVLEQTLNGPRRTRYKQVPHPKRGRLLFHKSTALLQTAMSGTKPQNDGSAHSEHASLDPVGFAHVKTATASTENGILDEVKDDAVELSRHAFGNYVVQHAFEHGSPALRHEIVQVMLPEICKLARHKSASHCVESALLHCGEEDRQAMKQAMAGDSEELASLTSSNFGSFVVKEMRKR
jgi:hypothetical protein